MCHFVFVGVPEKRRHVLERELTAAGLRVDAVRNPWILAAFPPTDSVAVVTLGGCSCGIYGSPDAAFNEAAERQKLRKKKWSERKIDRAVLGKRRPDGPLLVRFRSAFTQIVRQCSGARLLAHFFSGSVDDEELPIRGQNTLSLAQFLAQDGRYQANVVQHVTAFEVATG
ncbi:MAG: hypothetical protein HOW73_49820 [Polyangiaceae bacterium]|nr:hypothetical protein [Polyangiaceae bacterium]